MNCCDANGNCQQGFNCPVRASKIETRGKSLASERSWGEMPIRFVGDEPDTDELITRDFIKGALFALAGVVIGVFIAAAIYFY